MYNITENLTFGKWIPNTHTRAVRAFRASSLTQRENNWRWMQCVTVTKATNEIQKKKNIDWRELKKRKIERGEETEENVCKWMTSVCRTHKFLQFMFWDLRWWEMNWLHVAYCTLHNYNNISLVWWVCLCRSGVLRSNWELVITMQWCWCNLHSYENVSHNVRMPE